MRPIKWPSIVPASGQAMVEFIMTVGFSLGIIFLFIQLAFNMTSGYLAHYATFMASRNYLVVDHGANDEKTVFRVAENKAREMFKSYQLEKFFIKDGVLTFSPVPQPGPGNREAQLYVGSKFTFEKKLSFLPLVGGDKKATMISESFLGKEPTRGQCLQRICQIMNLKIGAMIGIQDICADNFQHKTLYDDGC